MIFFFTICTEEQIINRKWYKFRKYKNVVILDLGVEGFFLMQVI